MEEVLIPFPGPLERLPACGRVKSTLICASVLSLRERGHFDRYLQHVPATLRDELVYAPAGIWLPISLAVTHYTACEALGLNDEAILEMGNAVAKQTQRSVLALMLRVANESGVTPWSVLEQTPRLWARLYEGSHLAVHKLGPKDCDLHFAGNALIAIGYWRTGLRGVLRSLIAPFCRTAFIREKKRASTGVPYLQCRISWA